MKIRKSLTQHKCFIGTRVMKDGERLYYFKEGFYIKEQRRKNKIDWGLSQTSNVWRMMPQWFRKLYAETTLEIIDEQACRLLLGSIKGRKLDNLFKTYSDSQAILTGKTKKQSLVEFNKRYGTEYKGRREKTCKLYPFDNEKENLNF